MSSAAAKWVDAMALYHRLWSSETDLIRSIQEKASSIISFEGQVEFAAGAMEMADRLADLRGKKLTAARTAAALRRKIPELNPEGRFGPGQIRGQHRSESGEPDVLLP